LDAGRCINSKFGKSCHWLVFAQLDDIEKEIETAIANDEIYAATVPVPPATATWLEFREYEVFACRLNFLNIGL